MIQDLKQQNPFKNRKAQQVGTQTQVSEEVTAKDMEKLRRQFRIQLEK